LGFVTAANFGTTTAGVYASAIGLRNFASLREKSWTTLLIATLVPVALVGMLIPQLFFEKFGSFLALIAVAFAPLCGIQIIDYFCLRRRKLDIRAIYTEAPGSPYEFWGGFNPAAVIALLAGCGVYVALLNPLSYASAAAYRYLTASLPALVAAASVYWLLSLAVRARGRGGYLQA
jgi:NCS1 family nucleobase:cation symporter-1